MLEIVHDIVDAAREQPCLRNTLLHRSRLSYFILKKYLNFVLDRGLLEERMINDTRVYRVTNKGFRFLKSYDDLQSIMKSNLVQPQVFSSLIPNIEEYFDS